MNRLLIGVAALIVLFVLGTFVLGAVIGTLLRFVQIAALLIVILLAGYVLREVLTGWRRAA